MSGTTSETDEFVKVCTLGDLPIDQPVLAQVQGRPVAVVRTDTREVHAVDDICSHGNVSLAEGEIEGDTIECWLHGSCFDLFTGEPTGLPATKPIAVFAVRLEGDDVLISTTVQNNPS